MVHATCAALHCRSSSSTDKELKFHQFPHDAERRKIWITACKRSDVIDKDWDFFKHKHVCSLHFQKCMYSKKDRLKKSAIPSLHLSEKPLQHDCSTQTLESKQYVNQRSENDVSISYYVMPNVEKSSTITYTQTEDSLPYDINHVNIKEEIITHTKIEESESVEQDVEMKTENDFINDENSNSGSFEEYVEMKIEIVENEISPLPQSTQSLRPDDLAIMKDGGTLSTQAKNFLQEIDQGLTATIVNRTSTNPINTTMMPTLKRKMDGTIQNDKVIVLSRNADGRERSIYPEECVCNENDYNDMTRPQFCRACSKFLPANFAITVRRQIHLDDVTKQDGNKFCEAGTSGSVKAGAADRVELNAAGCGGVVLPYVVIAGTETADSAEADLYAVDRNEASAADCARRFVEWDGWESAPPASALPMQHLPSPPPLRRFRQVLGGEDVAEIFNYGSDSGSDESDNEDTIVLPVIPRVFRSVMETPLDAEDEDAGDEIAAGGDLAPAAYPVPAASFADPSPAAPARDSEPASVPPTTTDQPWRWYDFDWKEFPNSPIPPESRRETFSQSNVGPTTPRDNPYDIFIDIWDRPIMEHIASETNKYAQQVAAQMLDNNSLHPRSRIGRWSDTTVDELYVYFGVVLAMGIVVKSRLEEYWTATPDIFYTPGFSAHMSIDRFLVLSKCLHFNDNDAMCALEPDGSEARLYKIQPVLSHLNMKFQALYTPAQNLALDESLLTREGWLEIGQFIPNKAANKGIKTYEICESQTGYLWRFEIHAHKKSQPPPQQLEDPLEASTPSIVLRLIQGLEHKGYTLWMHNFYNSPCLARRLKSLGFDCVGTLRTDRKFVPQALHNLTKRNMRKGQLAGLTTGDVDAMVWRDNNRVAMISTYHGNGQNAVRGSTKPILILDYNIMMGGVDKKDQVLAMYPVERKRTRVWYKNLFRRLLNVSVFNAFIIHHHFSSLSHRNFRMTLIKTLLSKHRPRPPPSMLPATVQNQRVDVSHRIQEFDLSNARRRRRVCVVCKRRVQTYCVGCSKTLCMKDCFLKFHS